MNLTPKKDFLLKKEWADHHRELVVSSNFREALNAALIEQVLALPETSNPVEAAASYHTIIGARKFISHLLNIAEQVKAAPEPLPTNLDHTIR